MVDQKSSVLIVDDEQVICDLLSEELSERGHICATALNGKDALTKLATQDFDVALLDIKLPGMSGIQVLSKMRSENYHTAAIMITAVNNVDTAVEAMKLGASDYIVKPLDLDKVATSIRTVLEHKGRSPERSDDHTAVDVAWQVKSRKGKWKSFNQMNAIARGVEARLDSVSGHTKAVILRTIDISRQLRIPEKEIQRWACAKAMLYADTDRRIESLQDKLKQSPLAQSVLDMIDSRPCEPHLGKSQN